MGRNIVSHLSFSDKVEKTTTNNDTEMTKADDDIIYENHLNIVSV